MECFINKFKSHELCFFIFNNAVKSSTEQLYVRNYQYKNFFHEFRCKYDIC